MFHKADLFALVVSRIDTGNIHGKIFHCVVLFAESFLGDRNEHNRRTASGYGQNTAMKRVNISLELCVYVACMFCGLIEESGCLLQVYLILQ